MSDPSLALRLARVLAMIGALLYAVGDSLLLAAFLARLPQPVRERAQRPRADR